MGFSTALQGRAAHEALVVRQDAELRLMEVMKRALQLRAKCDKEYAINLASVAQQGLKIDRADEMQGKFCLYFVFNNLNVNIVSVCCNFHLIILFTFILAFCLLYLITSFCTY